MSTVLQHKDAIRAVMVATILAFGAAQEIAETRNLAPRLMSRRWQRRRSGGALPSNSLFSYSRFCVRKVFCARILSKSVLLFSKPERSLPLSRFERIQQCEAFTMLRITTSNCPQALTLRLEGRLEGPWVAVLMECWRGALAGSASRRRCVDLNGVTFIDGEGKARLAQLYAQGAEFIADDLMTKAIVAEIVGK